MNEEYLISIISVSYNCENDVITTIESLISQSFQDYEYIVVDGDSMDSTVELVSSFKEQFHSCSLISEPDKGIYDAMNKGVQMAKGRFVYFLNMGDIFYDDSVLERMVNEIEDGTFDIYYGDVKQVDGLIVQQEGKATLWWAIYREFMVCHQSIFTKREWLMNNPFDLKFSLCADRDWFIRCLRGGATTHYVKQCICIYDMSGVSSNLKKFQEDSLAVSMHYGGLRARMFIRIKRMAGKLRRGSGGD